MFYRTGTYQDPQLLWSVLEKLLLRGILIEGDNAVGKADKEGQKLKEPKTCRWISSPFYRINLVGIAGHAQLEPSSSHLR
ncbi:hypothetical protein B296_00041765 [Ensete ventricosum]|uniref:Uncharacterized protein n=1 Tax=Ensete ventricosum TaxID=4639 RepID=A0A426ZED2_ENSVE|nr:hypothetical protein B296_00041765 [Ensete ventricosum]